MRKNLIFAGTMGPLLPDLNYISDGWRKTKKAEKTDACYHAAH